MEKEQEFEWIEAQKIVITEDLVDAAKKQIKFLATVDRYRYLYDGPVLNRAIFRYKTYWLPLLAKHTKSELSEGPLVVPLDCEWVWHCHRLNPLRYKADCEEFYGQILDNKNVISMVQGASTVQTEEIWKRIYPEEPYEFDLRNSSIDDVSESLLGASKDIQYDFISAVKRQSPFFYQVSKPVMNDDMFLQEAVARYKGFLHMIKRNKERSIRRFSVPTYDVDLMWHSHQLHPVSYCTDLIEALGKVLEHDDTDSDRGKGQKLDVGFSGTTMQWEETFGTRYWRAGGMYRGVAPSPISIIPQVSNLESKTAVSPTESQKIIHLSNNSAVEVLLEIVEVRNLPDGHKGNLFVFFSKKNPDAFFGERKRLSILSESKGKQVAYFQCEPTGELFFELMSYSPSNLPISRPAKTIGTTTIPLENILDPKSKLSIEKWVELVPNGGILNSDPISLRVAVSVTPPTPAPFVLHMVRTRPTPMGTCFFSLPGVTQHAKGWTRVIDGSDNEVINIQMRDLKKPVPRNNGKVKREVVGVAGSGETHVLAEFLETGWFLMNSTLSSQLQKKPSGEDHIFELRGSRAVQLFLGRKLEYEPKNFQKQKNEGDFITAVDFSKQNPYGKAVALLNVKSGSLKVEEEWFVIPGITLAVIFFDIFRKEGNNVFTAKEKLSKKNGVVDVSDLEEKPVVEKEVVSEKSEVVVDEKDSTMVKKGASGGCGGGGCGGSGCGHMAIAGAMESMVKSGGCGGGGGCGSGCGNMVNSAGCGSGCGGGCGNMVNSAGCGSGCGSGCGNMVNSAGCGSACGGGCSGDCGNMVNSGGCGSGGCGSGCGNTLKSGGGCGGGGCGGNCSNGVAASA